jgi:hypothetical protein
MIKQVKEGGAQHEGAPARLSCASNKARKNG